jgi:hypothetical protein
VCASVNDYDGEATPKLAKKSVGESILAAVGVAFALTLLPADTGARGSGEGAATANVAADVDFGATRTGLPLALTPTLPLTAFSLLSASSEALLALLALMRDGALRTFAAAGSASSQLSVHSLLLALVLLVAT